MLLSSFCTFYFVHNNVSAMIIIGTFYLKLFLSMSNLFLLFLNTKNYYYLIKPLFLIPQILIIILSILINDYVEISIVHVFIPFFIIQFVFFLILKRIFINANQGLKN